MQEMQRMVVMSKEEHEEMQRHNRKGDIRDHMQKDKSKAVMPKESKPVILGEKTQVMLWGFKVTLKDRRTGGGFTDGYIVVTGDEEYDLEAAERQIRERYGRLGYTVTVCVYDETRVFNFDALQLFKQGCSSRCATCDYYIKPDSSVGLDEGCQLAIEAEDDGNAEEYQILEAAFCKNGFSCEAYEPAAGKKVYTEENTDFLTECLAALEELEEKEGEI